jgi:hypothetical protein
MKRLYILLLFVPLIALSQDKTIFLDSLMLPTDEGKHIFYRVVQDYDTDRKQYAFKEYYLSGNLKTEGFTSSKDYRTLTSRFISYYENGNKETEGEFVQGQPLGVFETWYPDAKKKLEGNYVKHPENYSNQLEVLQYWDAGGAHKVINGNGYFIDEEEYRVFSGKITNRVRDSIWTGRTRNGKISFRETYSNGKFISGTSTDESNISREYFGLEQKPEYAGGTAEFYKYVAKNYTIPNKGAAYGRIIVKFVVEKDGRITDIVIVRGLNEKMDAEAIRVVKSSTGWKPGLQRGIPVRVQYSLPIIIAER